MNASSKIKREHIEKLAFIYVRQSTPQGVKKNVVGGKRQEDVEQLALDLGWPAQNIILVKSDTGVTGASTEKRYGYLEMLCAITEGRVGAVFSLESTRLGRDSADWHYLIKICHLTNTLIIDPDGVYDASDCNDSTLMKFKALMGEMELRLITSRMQGARMELAKKGKLRINLPVGYVYSDTGDIIFDRDESVQRAVRLFFELFERLRSARAVACYLGENNILFPAAIPTQPGKYKWSRMSRSQAWRIVQNPTYAGTWVFGRERTVKKPVIADTGESQIKTFHLRVGRDQWRYVTHDSHPGYISWSQYLKNLEQLDDNRNKLKRRGAPRAGSALLQGLALCGYCGHRLWICYGTMGAYYKCSRFQIEYGHESCQIFRATGLDVAVEELFLRAIEPVQLKLTIEAIEQVHREAQSIDRQRDLQLEYSATAVAHSKDRLLHIDYNNKYAFECAQADLKEKEEELLRLKRQHQDSDHAQIKNISATEREQMRSLIKRIRPIWRAHTTSPVMKKNLLRCLISDVTIKRDGLRLEAVIRWKTNACSKVEVSLRRPVCPVRTPLEVIDFVRKLAPQKMNREIADALNEAGFQNYLGKDITHRVVSRIRTQYNLGPRIRMKRTPASPHAALTLKSETPNQRLPRRIAS